MAQWGPGCEFKAAWDKSELHPTVLQWAGQPFMQEVKTQALSAIAAKFGGGNNAK